MINKSRDEGLQSIIQIWDDIHSLSKEKMYRLVIHYNAYVIATDAPVCLPEYFTNDYQELGL